MATPVVTVASGGLPVVDVTATFPKMGLPVTEALAGRGIAVTKVAARGMPVTFKVAGNEWPFPPNPPPTSGGGGTSAEATAFLARTTGLDGTHTSAYTALINGLVADGIWAKLDVLYVFATQDAATAVLNLVSTNHTATPVGGPTFTADRGYTSSGTGPKYVNTNFNPSTAPSPKYVQNSAHLSGWSITTQTDSQPLVGGSNGSVQMCVFPRWAGGGNAYYFVNDTVGINVVRSDAIGHYLGNRSGANDIQGYRNGVSIVSSTSVGSSPVLNLNAIVGGQNQSGTISGSSHQFGVASIGASLNSAEVTAFYNRLLAYMTAVGVP